jgi:protocatechuate 4,5-dioxygenase beta chain
MARITASVYTSHVPAIGAALDLGKSHEALLEAVFAGYDFSKQWMKDNKPDVIFLVYNDHATAFSLEMIPDLRHRHGGGVHSPPTKAGARARCPR